jgi:hypothetical protein
MTIAKVRAAAYISPAMRISVGIIACALLLAGCQSDLPPTAEESAATATNEFGPVSMRIHPVFTQIKDWTGDGRPDGIEVLLEFDDQFHDPTKAAGQVVFELYSFRQASPDPRGRRLLNPWIGSLTSVADQEAHWNRTSRTYTFQLADPKISENQIYVLTATFDQEGGGRFFDRIILKGKKARLNQTKVGGNSKGL